MYERKIVLYGIIFMLLFVGSAGFFYRIRWLEWVEKLLRRTKEEMDEASRKRLLENRRDLLLLQQKQTVRYRLERELHYSGWKRRFPFLTTELWILGNVVLLSVTGVCVQLLLKKWVLSGGFMLGIICVEGFVLWICKLREMHSVNNSLLKFLNFLGNYSITSGEITGIFKQVSRYMEEPIKSALSECCYEAQTTGDVSGALLGMAEKIEHPKFKELARNMEISARYCADFSALVIISRKGVREYLRLGEERKGMLYEAVVSIVLLLIMSLFSLLTVDKLIAADIWDIVWNTTIGKIALSVVAGTLVLLISQFYKIFK